MEPSLFVWQGRRQGGAEYITYEVAHWLAERGWRVTLGMFHYDTTITLPQLVLPVPALVPDSFRSLVASTRWRRHAHRFDAVYSHTLGWWKTKDNVLFIHDAADLDAYLSETTTFPRRMAAALWKQLYVRLSIQPASTILAASKSFGDFCRRHGVPADRIRASGSFYDGRVFRYVERSQPRPPYRLLLIGNYTDPRKQFTTVRDALSQHDEVRLEVVGGPAAPADDITTFYGSQPRERVASLLQGTTVYLHPARAEGFSLALLEALATGIPCLANAAAVNPELQGIKNLVTYNQPQEIWPRLQGIVEHYDCYCGYDQQLAQFERARVLALEEQIMQSVLAARP